MVAESNSPAVVEADKPSEPFFERHKTVTAAVVSIVIAAMGFGSALVVSHIQRQAEEKREVIASATDLDTSAILIDAYVAEMMVLRDWIGEDLARDPAGLRRDVVNLNVPFDMRDALDEVIAQGRKMSQDTWSKVSKNYSPIRTDMMSVLFSFDDLLDMLRAFRSALSYPLEAWAIEQQALEAQLLEIEYKSIEPYSVVVLCEIFTYASHLLIDAGSEGQPSYQCSVYQQVGGRVREGGCPSKCKS